MATKYVVLKAVAKAVAAEPAFQEIGEQEASNDLQAIKEFLSQGDNGEKYGEGDYRAVPKRSWSDTPHEIRKKISFG